MVRLALAMRAFSVLKKTLWTSSLDPSERSEAELEGGVEGGVGEGGGGGVGSRAWWSGDSYV